MHSASNLTRETLFHTSTESPSLSVTDKTPSFRMSSRSAKAFLARSRHQDQGFSPRLGIPGCNLTRDWQRPCGGCPSPTRILKNPYPSIRHIWFFLSFPRLVTHKAWIDAWVCVSGTTLLRRTTKIHQTGRRRKYEEPSPVVRCNKRLYHPSRIISGACHYWLSECLR